MYYNRRGDFDVGNLQVDVKLIPNIEMHRKDYYTLLENCHKHVMSV